jgi:hypothetical protein
MGGGPSTPKVSQLERQGTAAAASQRLRDIRREDRRKVAVRTRQAGRLSLLGAPERGRQPSVEGYPAMSPSTARQYAGGGPQPAAGGYR